MVVVRRMLGGIGVEGKEEEFVMSMMRTSLVLVLFTLILSGCLPMCRKGPGDLGLERVAGRYNNPLFVTAAPGDDSRLFVVEQAGRIRVVHDGAAISEPFLDIRDNIATTSGERGLLGLAFHPNYGENGVFFVNYTNLQNDTQLSRFQVSDDPNRADHDSETIVLETEQPRDNHNGGMLAFGPNDGYLYVAMGDGGGQNDPGNNGQDLGNLLGAILRIDVDNGDPYAVPEDNPFVDTPGARPEIWAYGLRNPWRFSFDRETGDLWIADVGERAREEINFQPASSAGGENYGWRVREGTICRPGESNCDLPGAVDPIFDYSKPIARSITGGYVYRGSAAPQAQGLYFFADFITGEVWSLRYADGEVTEFTDRSGDLRPPALAATISSFGEDNNGELYLTEYLGGRVYRIVSRL